MLFAKTTTKWHCNTRRREEELIEDILCPFVLNLPCPYKHLKVTNKEPPVYKISVICVSLGLSFAVVCKDLDEFNEWFHYHENWNMESRTIASARVRLQYMCEWSLRFGPLRSVRCSHRPVMWPCITKPTKSRIAQFCVMAKNKWSGSAWVIFRFWYILNEQSFYIILKFGSIKCIISRCFCRFLDHVDQYFYSLMMVVAIIACVLSFPYKRDYHAYFEPLQLLKGAS